MISWLYISQLMITRSFWLWQKHQHQQSVTQIKGWNFILVILCSLKSVVADSIFNSCFLSKVERWQMKSFYLFVLIIKKTYKPNDKHLQIRQKWRPAVAVTYTRHQTQWNVYGHVNWNRLFLRGIKKREPWTGDKNDQRAKLSHPHGCSESRPSFPLQHRPTRSCSGSKDHC